MTSSRIPEDSDAGVIYPSRRSAIVLAALLVHACASAPDKDEEGVLFYPSLPDPPRVQHLTSFSKARDLGQQSSQFADFVLGKDDTDELVTKPYGVAIHNNKIYVVDTRGPGYVVLDLTLKRTKAVAGSGGGRMKKPINITIDADGTKYVTDTGRDQILVFDVNDEFVRALGTEGQFKPADVAIVGERLYVGDLKNHQIQVLNKYSGALIMRIATEDLPKDQVVLFPTNLAVTPDGHLLVSDTGNFRIQKYTLDGTFVRSFGAIGSALGKFARPKGIAVDREGRMYAVDAAFENVQIFNDEGQLLLFFGSPGGKRDSINLPTDVTIDYDSVAYFQQFADPNFKLEYVIVVASQFGVNKVNVFGHGKMAGMNYPIKELPVDPPAAPQ